ncbi:MAG: hypothetical protein HPY62_01960 [Bacteroidales bacterium]|nr:hypothetical protein [Bacteroidales bacterium]
MKTKRFIIVILFLIPLLTCKIFPQTTMPEALLKENLKEQMKYLEDKTRIYENYRAIREDMFQKIKSNALDSLASARNQISSLKNINAARTETIDSLSRNLENTKTELEEITKTKNSIDLLGLKVSKSVYNSIMWTIIAGLLVVIAIGYVALKRSLAVTKHTKNELKELKEEYEAYRKSSREAREKMARDHFNEIRRLKGG